MIYVVLGMHKSGTTLVSEILHHSGISMGEIDTSLTYDDANQYEDDASLHLNMELIGARDFEVLLVPAPDPPVATDDQLRRMREFVGRRSEDHADWGFKDPRTALVYPLWEEVLPEHRIIAVWRAPEEVWPRFAAPGPGLAHEEPRRAWNFVQRWCEHNDGIVRALRRTTNDFILMNYGDFMMGDQDFERLQEFVGRPLRDRRRKELYRSRRKRHLSYEISKRLVRWRNGMDPEATVRDLRALRGE